MSLGDYGYHLLDFILVSFFYELELEYDYMVLRSTNGLAWYLEFLVLSVLGAKVDQILKYHDVGSLLIIYFS